MRGRGCFVAFLSIDSFQPYFYKNIYLRTTYQGSTKQLHAVPPASSWRKTTVHGSRRTIHGVDGQVMAENDKSF